jgi:hypothetical protein
MASPLRPGFGPTLLELLAPRWRRLGARARMSVVAAGAVAVVLAAVALSLAIEGDNEYVHREFPTFNLRWADELERVSPRPGEYLRLEQRRGPLFLQSFAVAPLRLPPYRGDPAGELPIYAETHIAALARRLEGFQPGCDGCGEGKTRINDVPGYAISFRAKLGSRTLYGRDVLIVPEEEGVRDGVVLSMRATPAAKVAGPGAVGSGGVLKLPLRSFRFGTEGG